MCVEDPLVTFVEWITFVINVLVLIFFLPINEQQATEHGPELYLI